MTLGNGQGAITYSFYYLDICCHQIELKFTTRPIEEWTNTDYLRLKNVLLQQTDVAISPNTLKRIFGKLKTSSRYYPQKATRDALAIYIGYTDWESFVAGQSAMEQPTSPVSSSAGNPLPPATAAEMLSIADEPTEARKHALRKYGLIITGLLIIIMTALLIRYNLNKKEILNPLGKVHLICQNPEGNAAPHSVVFRLQIPEGFHFPKGQFTIDFGDNRPVKKIRPGELVTHFYEIPGRYYAKLKYEEQPVDTFPVYLKTSGWLATASMPTDTMRVYPIESPDIAGKEGLSANAVNLYHSGIDTSHTFYVNFINARPLPISADNFELTIVGQTSESRPGVRCSEIDVTVYGEKTKHSFVIMKPGCEAFMDAFFSDWLGNGIYTDLSALSADLTKGGRIRLTIIDKRVVIYINEKEVFKTSYHISAGNIYGVGIVFSGIGKIFEVNLKNLQDHKETTLLPVSK
ncbi:hypothetical protein [Chitinophaga sp. RAB17]|uniref:hypothetical protein n=1 Tax=Chitinophaga sp. RAB17 TaxID=3233049 RepID=UPI003F933B56